MVSADQASGTVVSCGTNRKTNMNNFSADLSILSTIHLESRGAGGVEDSGGMNGEKPDAAAQPPSAAV